MNHRQHTWRGFSILFPLLLIGFIFSTGCETSSPDLFANLDSLRLPFEEGRVWEYEYTYSEIYAQGTYNSDSRRRAVVRITASGIDTLDNGWVANLLVTDWEMWYEVGDSLTVAWFDTMRGTEYNWYQQRDDGLYIVAYEISAYAPALTTPKRQLVHVLLDGVEVPLSDVSVLGIGLMSFSPHLTGEGPFFEPYIEENPPVVLQYPLEVGASWYYRPVESTITITKEVVALERVSTPAGVFDCSLLQVRSYLYDDEVPVYQWQEGYGREGLIFREVETPRWFIVTDEIGVLVDSFRVEASVELTRTY